VACVYIQGCTTCPKGYVSDESSSMCAACPPGKFSLFPGMGVCTPCPPGEYAPGAGSDSCRKCGHGTISGLGATSCDVSADHCQYKVDDNTVYDLHKLTKVNEPMYGPIDDTNNSVKYFLNLCGQTHLNTTCLGRDGTPIYGLACQQMAERDSIYGQSLAVSLGDTMAFYNLEDDAQQGLVVSIQGGGWCSNNVQRTLNITMRCDMSAGAGYPELPDNGVVETRKCAYELVWWSQYACPMCTARDMRTIPGLSVCISCVLCVCARAHSRMRCATRK
jgi:hypothetical protein